MRGFTKLCLALVITAMGWLFIYFEKTFYVISLISIFIWQYMAFLEFVTWIEVRRSNDFSTTVDIRLVKTSIIYWLWKGFIKFKELANKHL